MSKYVLRMLVAATFLAIAGGCSPSEKTLKLAVFIPDRATTYAQVIQPWLDTINLEGAGVLRIEAFTGGTLGSNPAAQPDLVLDSVADLLERGDALVQQDLAA